MTFPYQKVTFNLVAALPVRSQDVLVRRFGLEKEEPETLEAIGQRHGITRERVRQIVEDGILQIKEEMRQKKERERVEEIFRHIASLLAESGHVKRQDLLLHALGASDAQGHVVLLLHLGDRFYKHKETENAHPFWTTKKEFLEISPRLLDAICEYLQERKEALELEELARAHRVHANQAIHAKTLVSLLEVSKHIACAHDGKWGLREWPVVYPRGMRDKAYLALREAREPLHFQEVAKRIEQLQEKVAAQSVPLSFEWRKRSVLPQTVHNELIKDPRFVLVGRGTYALAEWGFMPGTVKDVIRALLQEKGAPMAKEEIVEKALAQRRVKESTILLNLQDKTCFLRQGGGYICVDR